MSVKGEWRPGGGKRRSGAAMLLKSVSVFFSVGQKVSVRRDKALPQSLAPADMKLKEGKGTAKMIEYFRKQTHFSRQEIESLCALYQKLVISTKGDDEDETNDSLQSATPTSHTGAPLPQRRSDAAGGGELGLDRITFRELLDNTFGVVTEDEVLVDRIFCSFDKQSDGYIDIEEWLLGLSVFLRGTLEESAAFTFSVYDLNNDGYIVKEEMLHLLRNSLIKQPQDEDPDEGVKDLVEIVMKKLDLDHDGRVSFDDFLGAVNKESLFLEAFGQCLPTEAASRAFLLTLAA